MSARTAWEDWAALDGAVAGTEGEEAVAVAGEAGLPAAGVGAADELGGFAFRKAGRASSSSSAPKSMVLLRRTGAAACSFRKEDGLDRVGAHDMGPSCPRSLASSETGMDAVGSATIHRTVTRRGWLARRLAGRATACAPWACCRPRAGWRAPSRSGPEAYTVRMRLATVPSR